MPDILLEALLYLEVFHPARGKALAALAILVAPGAVAWVRPGWARRMARMLNATLASLGRRPMAATIFVALPVVAAGVILLGSQGLPLPRIHDEFSYLLAADPFLHGRLANAAHPLWQHFETFHVNQQPTYASMYQPGSGLVLAAGALLLGHAWFGVWFTAIAMTIAIHWTARAWLPSAWALKAGLVAATIVSFDYWLDSYWGGALPATGGALVIGSVPRLARQSSVRVALLFALGCLILVYTRPYEGLALIGAASVALAWRRVSPRRVLLPIAAVGILGFGWLAFYNWRVTGNPLAAPYALNAATYHHRKIFVFGDDSPPPIYRHEEMRRLYSDEFRLKPFSRESIYLLLIPAFGFYAGPLQVFSWLALPWILGKPSLRGLVLAIAPVVATVLLTVWTRAHYLAPAAAGLVILPILGLRYLKTFRLKGRRIGRLVSLGALVGWLGATWVPGFVSLSRSGGVEGWPQSRAAIIRTLERSGGAHLILVKYDASHNPHAEWVYNGADLQHAPVVWARAMDADSNRVLMAHYADRLIWLLEPESNTELRRLH